MKNRVACATPLQEMAPAVPKSVALGASHAGKHLRFVVWLIETISDTATLQVFGVSGYRQNPHLLYCFVRWFVEPPGRHSPPIKLNR